jgi:hypothetical protein
LVILGLLIPLLAKTALLGLFHRHHIDSGGRKMTGPARQECDLFVLDIEREPTATNRSNTDDGPLPTPQLATAVTQDHVLVVQLDNHF